MARKPIQLIYGDCRHVLPTLPRGSVDAIITDPPYAIVAQFGTEKRRRGQGRRLQFGWDTEQTAAMVVEGLALAFELCYQAAACFCFTGADQYAAYAEPARDNRFTVKPFTWVKQCPPPAGRGTWWPSAFDLAYYGYRGQAWFGDRDRKRCNVYWGDTLRHGNGEKLGHPTQRPLELMMRIVRSICPPDGLVVDPFGGSGTTAAACRLTGRRCIVVESNPEYFTMAAKRLGVT